MFWNPAWINKSETAALCPSTCDSSVFGLLSWQREYEGAAAWGSHTFQRACFISWVHLCYPHLTQREQQSRDFQKSSEG